MDKKVFYGRLKEIYDRKVNGKPYQKGDYILPWARKNQARNLPSMVRPI